MDEKFEPKNIDEIDQVLKYFNHFHDGYVEGIEIKFENYKSIDDNGVANGIGKADMTIILTVNAYPYGKDHNQLVQVEFKDIKSSEIISERHKSGPEWGIFEVLTKSASKPHEDEVYWDFAFLGDKARYEVTCSKIVFTNMGYIMNKA